MRTWIFFSIFLFSIIPFTEVSANVGAPYFERALTMEPRGLKEIAIAREWLKIDLRPLEQGGEVEVEAIYLLRNDGEAQDLDLNFITGLPSADRFEINLNGRPVPVALIRRNENEVPRNWKVPSQTPPLEGSEGDSFSYGAYVSTFAAFSLHIPPGGLHALTVRYQAEPGMIFDHHPLLTWQFAYILAPARDWKSFGGLELTVLTPPRWRVASEPRLQKVGDSFHALFPDLPADSVALTARSPLSPLYWVLVFGGWGLFLLLCLFGGITCWRRGRRDGIRKRVWSRALLGSLIWGVSLCLAGMMATYFPYAAIPDPQETHYAYVDILQATYSIFLALCSVPIGFSLWMTGAFMARRRKAADLLPQR